MPVTDTKKTPRIELRKAGSQEFYFVFRLPSDGMFISVFFESIPEVTAAIENLQRQSATNGCYLIQTTSPEKAYFIFKPKNKHPIGQSTMYEHISTMEIGLQYMKQQLLSADVVDLTE